MFMEENNGRKDSLKNDDYKQIGLCGNTLCFDHLQGTKIGSHHVSVSYTHLDVYKRQAYMQVNVQH